MKLYSANGTLQPVSPFHFEKALDFLGSFAPMHDEQTLAPSGLTKTVSIDLQPMVFQLGSQGTVEAPCLNYTFYSAQTISNRIRAAALDRVRFFLSLDDDLNAFYSIARRDPLFASIVEQLYGLHQVKFMTPFENACWAVLSQRVPITVARELKHALVDKFGSQLEVNGKRYQAFPEPAQLARTSPKELNGMIKNERKADYMRAVIDAFQNVDEEFLRVGDYDAVRSWLLGIKGIGEWSADFILLRGLGRMQQLHISRASIFEKRMSQAASRVYAKGKALTGKEILSIAERYGEWQGYWAYYLRAAA